MKIFLNRSYVRLTALILIIALSLSCLASCFGRYVAETKDEFIENVAASESKGYSSVASYLKEWGFPSFNSVKVSSAELTFNSYYNYGDGMPDAYLHAKETAELFIEYYYDEINLNDKTAVTDALLTCYVYALDDPYAAYRPAEETDEYFEDMSGKFGGIGVMIEYDYKALTIMVNTVYPNSPAEKAGIQVGDYIIGVDGKTVEEIGIDNVVYMVRGKIGTSVELTLLRQDKEITLTAVRDEVEEINAYHEEKLTEDGIGYIRIVSFKDNTFNQFRASVDALEQMGAKAIIFDLRSNPGGYLYSVVEVISYLVPSDNIIVTYRYKAQDTAKVYTSDDDDVEGGDHTVNIPIVVLCNEYTASAGEIFTAALRDYSDDKIINATIVGTNTYGKGIMQNTFSYSPDDSSFTMTVAYYDPPCGINYHGIGVQPDITVELTEDGDAQLDAAYEALKNILNAN